MNLSFNKLLNTRITTRSNYILYLIIDNLYLIINNYIRYVYSIKISKFDKNIIIHIRYKFKYINI